MVGRGEMPEDKAMLRETKDSLVQVSNSSGVGNEANISVPTPCYDFENAWGECLINGKVKLSFRDDKKAVPPVPNNPCYPLQFLR